MSELEAGRELDALVAEKARVCTERRTAFCQKGNMTFPNCRTQGGAICGRVSKSGRILCGNGGGR